MLTILSGGQTGVDRAALDIAMAAGWPVSGWCPEGRQAEDGAIKSRYPLQPLPVGDYAARTARNVLHFDATLVIFFTRLSGGSRLTSDCWRRFRKPCLLIDGDHQYGRTAIGSIIDFIDAWRVQRRNVAGPRASEQASAHRVTSDLLARS
jgi:hypothetical protein